MVCRGKDWLLSALVDTVLEVLHGGHYCTQMEWIGVACTSEEQRCVFRLFAP